MDFKRDTQWTIGRNFLTCMWLVVLLSSTVSSSQVENKEGEEVIPDVHGCRSCPPGSGVMAVCNTTHDTVCAPCPHGTFNNHFTVDFPCVPCSSCPEGTYRRTPCVPHQDTMCASCFKIGRGGFGNEDFLRKCEPLKTTTTTTQPTTTTTTTQTSTAQQHVISTTNTTKPTTEEEEGSGDFVVVLPPGKDEEEPSEEEKDKLIPVEKPTTKSPKTTRKILPSTTREEVTMGLFHGEPMVGEQRAEEEKEKIDKGFFQWPILVAAVVAAIVCFVLGVLFSVFIHRSPDKEPLSYSIEDEQNGIRTTMISPRPDYENDVPDVKTPIYLGKKQTF